MFLLENLHSKLPTISVLISNEPSFLLSGQRDKNFHLKYYSFFFNQKSLRRCSWNKRKY